MLRLELAHDPLKFSKHTDINGAVLGFDLDDQARAVKAQRTFTGNDINAAVCTRRRDHHAVAMRF